MKLKQRCLESNGRKKKLLFKTSETGGSAVVTRSASLEAELLSLWFQKHLLAPETRTKQQKIH